MVGEREENDAMHMPKMPAQGKGKGTKASPSLPHLLENRITPTTHST